MIFARYIQLILFIILLNLEYISNATGIDIKEIKKLLTYEYIVTTLPVVMLLDVVINSIIEKTKNTDFIIPTKSQFLPCSVDSNISNFLLRLKKETEVSYPLCIAVNLFS